jgi:hypothetical protein
MKKKVSESHIRDLIDKKVDIEQLEKELRLISN